MTRGVKLTGAEYHAFTTAEWGPDWYWDDTLFTHNGDEVEDIGEVQPDDKIVLLEGTVYKGMSWDSPSMCALKFARQWLKQQTVTSITVEVPNEDVAAFKQAMKEKRYRVL